MNTMNGEGAPEGIDEQAENTRRIAALNDQLRVLGQGGQIVATQGFNALPEMLKQSLFSAIRQFNGFTRENDPYQEHDAGVIEVNGVSVYWKIDYYDLNHQMHSPNAADPQVTSRVMTIMLLSEY